MFAREAKLSDAEFIAEISTDSLGYPCEAGLVERRLKDLNAGRERVFVVENDGIIEGFVQAEVYKLLFQEDSINILGLAVRKDSQKQGVGRMLMGKVEEWATEKGCRAVRLNSAIKRTDAHAFYEHLGYENTKQQKRFIKMIDR